MSGSFKYWSNGSPAGVLSDSANRSGSFKYWSVGSPAGLIYQPAGDMAGAAAIVFGAGSSILVGAGTLSGVAYPDFSQIFGVDLGVFVASSSYLDRSSLVGVPDSNKGLLSFWLNITSNGTYRILRSNNMPFQITLGDLGGGLFRIELETINFDGSGYVYVRTVDAVLFGEVHLLASWDADTGAVFVYLDDVDMTALASEAISDPSGELRYESTGSWGIGANDGGSIGYDGGLGEFYFNSGHHLDLSVEANRRKFIDSRGRAVYLGADGSVPTGTVPQIYLHLDNGEDPSNLGLNRGSGGDFTEQGTLTSYELQPNTGPATLTGAGALLGTTAITFTPVAALVGSGALLGTSNFAFTLAGAFQSSGDITGSSAVIFANSAALVGAGVLLGTAAAAAAFTNSGTLVGAGALLGTSAITFAPVAVLGGAGALLGTTTLTFVTTATIIAPVAAAGSADVVFSLSGTAAGAGTLAGVLLESFANSATAAGAGVLSGLTSLTITPQGVLLADGALAGSSVLTLLATATQNGLANLVGSTATTFDLSGTLEDLVFTSIEGVASMAFTLSGTLADVKVYLLNATMVFANLAEMTLYFAQQQNMTMTFSEEVTQELVMRGTNG